MRPPSAVSPIVEVFVNVCCLVKSSIINVVKCLFCENPSTGLAEIWPQFFPRKGRFLLILVLVRYLVSKKKWKRMKRKKNKAKTYDLSLLRIGGLINNSVPQFSMVTLTFCAYLNCPKYISCNVCLEQGFNLLSFYFNVMVLVL